MNGTTQSLCIDILYVEWFQHRKTIFVFFFYFLLRFGFDWVNSFKFTCFIHGDHFELDRKQFGKFVLRNCTQILRFEFCFSVNRNFSNLNFNLIGIATLLCVRFVEQQNLPATKRMAICHILFFFFVLHYNYQLDKWVFMPQITRRKSVQWNKQ